MGLFHLNSQYREVGAIWRLFETKLLIWTQVNGLIFRWFAVNIPLDFRPGSPFKGDLDLIICLRQPPGKTPKIIYKTIEVKAATIDRAGKPHSLKLEKTKYLDQLKVHRDFGSPSASLLDLIICEDGYLSANTFPPREVEEAMSKRSTSLKLENFGYRVLTFEHETDGTTDYCLKLPADFRKSTVFEHEPMQRSPAGAFEPLAKFLDEYVTSQCANGKFRLGDAVLIYCKSCRDIDLVTTKDHFMCPKCKADLITQ